MAKKRTVATPPNKIIQNAILSEGAYISTNSPEGWAKAGEAIKSFQAISRISQDNDYEVSLSHIGGRQMDFSNILPGISSKPGLNWQDYEWFRPEEATPTLYREIMSKCNHAYINNGLVRQIIDLMGDFTAQGIRVSHKVKKNQTFIRNWWRAVQGTQVSERFCNGLYRLSTVAIRQQNATLTRRIKDELYKVNAEAEIIPEISTGKIKDIPWKFTFLYPGSVSIIGGQLASFVGGPRYALQIPGNICTLINSPQNKLEKELVSKIPADIKRAAKQNLPYPLDKDKTFVYHYKKDDWQPWPYPMTYAMLKHIMLLDKLILADSAALDGAISSFRIFKLGSLEHQIAPSNAAVEKLADILQNNVGGGVFDLVWGPDIELIESNTSVHQFLGEEKYKPTMRAIYEGYGIPATLTGGNTAGGTTNNYISLKTLQEKLEYGRSILRMFWEGRLKVIQEAMGWKTPAVIEFDLPSLGDENAENALFLQLVDRNLVSDEIIQLRFGQHPEMENSRIRRETREKKAGRRVHTPGGFDSPQNHEAELKKIALQTGQASPSEVGLELEEKEQENLLELQKKLMPKPVPGAGLPAKKKKAGPTKPKGRPGQGRPVNKKDSTKRKTKTFKPKMKAMIEIWAKNAQDKVDSIINPVLLNHFGKDNMRKLSKKEEQYSEKIKSSVLYNLEAMSEISENIVNEALKIQYSVAIATKIKRYEEILTSEYVSQFNQEPSRDDFKQIRAVVYLRLLEKS